MVSVTQVNMKGPVNLESWREILCQAIKEVFSLMVGLPVTDHEDGEPMVVSDLTAMVGLAGALCGILTIRCSAYSGSRIASLMLGIDIGQGSEHQSDAIGEMCNMAAGNFKANVAGLEDKCMLSAPTVITGSEYQVHSLASGKRIELAFLFEGDPIWVSLDIES